MIDVQAQSALHDAESAAAVDPIYALVGQVQEELGDKGAEDTFLRLFGHALDKRLSTAAEATGLIQLWDYRTILRQVPMQGLAPFTRSNLLNIFDQVRPSYTCPAHGFAHRVPEGRTCMRPSPLAYSSPGWALRGGPVARECCAPFRNSFLSC